MTQNRNLSILADQVNSSGVLGTAGGGTGLSSTPANGQLDIGNGTGFTRATITAGTGITVTNGAGSISIASSVTAPQVYSQLFTASGTWTAPTGVTRVRVWVVGGGGGACFATGACNYSASGGAGGVAVGVYTVTPGTGYTVTIGAGGAGAQSSGSAVTGATGGTTSFGGVISATGGAGGNYNGAGTVTDGTSGTGSSGTVYNSLGYKAVSPNTFAPVNMAPNYGTNAAQNATAVAASGLYAAGIGGTQATPPRAGVGGMVYLEWNQ